MTTYSLQQNADAAKKRYDSLVEGTQPERIVQARASLRKWTHVRVYVPEPWLGLIQLGQPVKVRTDSSRDKFTGTIEQINRAAEFTPRNVQTVEDRMRQVFGVKVRLPSDTGKLRAGMSLDVFFPNVPPLPK